jgi:hypothetical protein
MMKGFDDASYSVESALRSSWPDGVFPTVT